MRYRNYDNTTGIVQCGCWIILLAFNFLAGGWSVNYLLLYFLAKEIPFWGAGLIGLIVGEISIPVALVVALLRYFHVM